MPVNNTAQTDKKQSDTSSNKSQTRSQAQLTKEKIQNIAKKGAINGRPPRRQHASTTSNVSQTKKTSEPSSNNSKTSHMKLRPRSKSSNK